MSRRTEYNSYLESPAWKLLRGDARRRANGKCEMCNGTPDHVHHIKYPKQFKDDHIDNLLVVCESCHRKLHGIRTSKYRLTDFSTVDLGDGETWFGIGMSDKSNPKNNPGLLLKMEHLEKMFSSEMEKVT